MCNTPVKFKGSNFTISVIYLYDTKLEVIRTILEGKIAQAPNLLKHAPVVINLSKLTAPISWKQLYHTLITTGLRIIGVSGCKDLALKEEIDKTGLPILTEGKNKKYNSFIRRSTILSSFQETVIVAPIAKTRLIEMPVRSGQCIYAANCDLIVTNHVNSGAELIADGNVHIYGIMNGRVLAGASGDQSAQIFCTHLTPELVSVAGIYWSSDKIPAEFYGKAARLRLIENALTIQSLN